MCQTVSGVACFTAKKIIGIVNWIVWWNDRHSNEVKKSIALLQTDGLRKV